MLVISRRDLPKHLFDPPAASHQTRGHWDSGPLLQDSTGLNLTWIEPDGTTTGMAVDIDVAGQERAEFPFPTPPASDEGDGQGKRDGDDARYGGGSGSSDDDSCEGCRKIKQDEVWRLQRQRKNIGEFISFVSLRPDGWV